MNHWYDLKLPRNKAGLQNTKLYNGKEYEPELGLYYYRNRYYSPTLGKFINQDPLLYIDGPNPYTYVNNNPVNFVDPWGLEKRLLIQKYIISIFDLAIKSTSGSNILVLYKGTQGGGFFDIKRNPIVSKYANNNGGIINFNGVDVEPSNLGNLLFGMNVENNYLPNFIGWNLALSVEKDNAKQEGYKEYSNIIAKQDEYSDKIRYKKGVEILDKYKNSNTYEEKLAIITNAISETNPEYYKRYKKEQEVRKYYLDLLSKKSLND